MLSQAELVVTYGLGLRIRDTNTTHKKIQFHKKHQKYNTQKTIRNTNFQQKNHKYKRSGVNGSN